MMKLDLLVITAHPDDAELGCGGTILSHIEMGYKVGLADLTRGELGTRGTAETRKAEANDAANILGVAVRENLGLPDGFFVHDKPSLEKVIGIIRKYQPEIVITNAIEDRHPDHPRASKLVEEACFLSGLLKVETIGENDENQEPWRPGKVYHCVQSSYIEPDFVIDISNHWDGKLKAIQAFKTQFFSPDTDNSGEQTFISTPEFIHFLEARAIHFGKSIGVKYAEGFTSSSVLGVENLFNLR